MRWERCTKKKKCPICGKTQWCAIAPDANLVLCMHLTSPTPSQGNAGGWLHKLDGVRDYVSRPVLNITPTPPLDAWAWWEKHLMATTEADLKELADDLGVSPDSLEALGTTSMERGWAFPMHDAKKNIIGIRTRGKDGAKKAVTGSRSGIFIPFLAPLESRCYVTEGPTDCAAGLDLGLYCIGRPSCMGQEDIIADYVKKSRFKEVVIIIDHDSKETARTAVAQGLKRLQELLTVPSVDISLPKKDLREFLKAKGTKRMIESKVASTVWTSR